MLARAAFLVGRRAHDVMDVTSVGQLAVVKVVAGVGFAVDGHLLDVAALSLAGDGHLFAVLQAEYHLVEIGRTEHVLVTARAHGVEA